MARKLGNAPGAGSQRPASSPRGRVVVPTFDTVQCVKCRTSLPLDPPGRPGHRITCGVCSTELTLGVPRKPGPASELIFWAKGAAIGAVVGSLVFGIWSALGGGPFLGGLLLGAVMGGALGGIGAYAYTWIKLLFFS